MSQMKNAAYKTAHKPGAARRGGASIERSRARGRPANRCDNRGMAAARRARRTGARGRLDGAGPL
jgi:hypothetical protein